MKRRRLNIKKVNEKKRSNTEKQNVKLVAVSAAEIIAPVSLERRRTKKSRKNARQQKVKYLNIYIKK